MFCRHCGKEVSNQAVVCVACGCPPLGGLKFCQVCGAESHPAAELCVKCGCRLARAGGPKSKLAAGLFGIFLGGFGVHRFYLGYVGIGIAQIAATILCCGTVGPLWGFIEGILLLAGSMNRDAEGRPLRD